MPKIEQLASKVVQLLMNDPEIQQAAQAWTKKRMDECGTVEPSDDESVKYDLETLYLQNILAKASLSLNNIDD